MKIEVNIPQTLNDITVEQYQKYHPLTEEKDIDTDFFMRRIMSIFYDVSGDVYSKMKLIDIEALIDGVMNCINQTPVMQQRFKFKDVEYGLIPNFDDMTFGEFVDLDKYTGIDKLDRMLSVLYRPVVKTIGRRYLIEPYSGTHDMFKGLSLGIALGVLDFFLRIAQQLLGDMMKSLEGDHPAEMKKIFQENGIGTQVLTRLREGTYLNMTALQNSTSTPYSQN